MPGHTKIFDLASEWAGELRREMRHEFLSDGVLEANEQRLLDMADTVCAHTASTASFVRVGVRWLGGGDVAGDEGLMGQVRDCDGMAREARQAGSPPGRTNGLLEVEESEAA